MLLLLLLTDATATATAAAASATATAAASGHSFFMKRGRLVVSCGSGWKTAGYFMMKLPHLFMKTQRDSDETPDVARLCGFPAAGTAHP